MRIRVLSAVPKPWRKEQVKMTHIIFKYKEQHAETRLSITTFQILYHLFVNNICILGIFYFAQISINNLIGL